MIGRVNTAGGAPYATINVECPASSSVTCALSNGSSAVTPVGGNGKYTFLIPSNGTWRLSGVYGSKTQTVDVVITQRGQCEFAHMEFPKYLYSYGNQYTSTTGGWRYQSADYGVVTFNSDYINLYGPQNKQNSCLINTANKINITGYKYLCVNIRNAIMSLDTYSGCTVLMGMNETIHKLQQPLISEFSTAKIIGQRKDTGDIPTSDPMVYKIPLSHMSTSTTYYPQIMTYYASVDVLEVYLV